MMGHEPDASTCCPTCGAALSASARADGRALARAPARSSDARVSGQESSSASVEASGERSEVSTPVVTEEMILAGVDGLLDYDRDFGSLSETLTEIYVAMENARRGIADTPRQPS